MYQKLSLGLPLQLWRCRNKFFTSIFQSFQLSAWSCSWVAMLYTYIFMLRSINITSACGAVLPTSLKILKIICNQILKFRHSTGGVWSSVCWITICALWESWAHTSSLLQELWAGAQSFDSCHSCIDVPFLKRRKHTLHDWVVSHTVHFEACSDVSTQYTKYTQ